MPSLKEVFRGMETFVILCCHFQQRGVCVHMCVRNKRIKLYPLNSAVH